MPDLWPLPVGEIVAQNRRGDFKAPCAFPIRRSVAAALNLDKNSLPHTAIHRFVEGNGAVSVSRDVIAAGSYSDA